MTVKFVTVDHKIINKNGWSLWLPSPCIQGLENFDEPDIYAQSSVQLYPMGTKLEFADGRVFRYGKIGATSTGVPIARTVCNANFVPGSDDVDGFEGALDSTSNYAIGSTTLVIDDVEDRAENYYEDGMLAVYPSGHYVEYRILGNEAATSVDDVTIYIDPGLKTALTVASTGVTAYPSIYSQMEQTGNAGAGYESVLGVCLATGFTATYWAWVQRRGRAIITPTAYFGDSANERGVFYNPSDGTIGTAATYDPSSGYQCLGYLTQRTTSGYGDLEVWLNLE
jgi:hypothetical protein